ncbi:MAG: DNA recombination protein RmuC [Bacteroidota bacterium]|jgi:rmuC domain protein
MFITALVFGAGLFVGAIVAVVVYFFLNKNIEMLESDNSALRQELSARQAEATTLVRETERLRAEADNTAERLAEQRKEITALHEELNKEFRLLANEIFDDKSRRFAQLNEERLQTILDPLKENLNKFEKKIDETYNQETREKAALRKELEQIISINRQMSDDAQKLTDALKGDKKMQGNWGEMQLEQILEKSGLEQGVHYTKQGAYQNEEGERVIPDYVIHLPQGKNYIIDSKVSLVNYERFFNAEGDEQKAYYFNEMVRDIKKHIDGLSKKSYHTLTNTPDFVFMYFAFESALFAALQREAGLFDYAFKRNIILVSTTTLLASLRTVSFIWTQEKQRQNITEIAKLGGQLYDKFVGFLENMTKVGKSLESAKDTYQDAMNQLIKTNANGSYNAGTIVGQAEALRRLGATPSKQIPQAILNRAENEENNLLQQG